MTDMTEEYERGYQDGLADAEDEFAAMFTKNTEFHIVREMRMGHDVTTLTINIRDNSRLYDLLVNSGRMKPLESKTAEVLRTAFGANTTKEYDFGTQTTKPVVPKPTKRRIPHIDDVMTVEIRRQIAEKRKKATASGK